MSTTEDIREIKSDVKEIRKLLSEALVTDAVQNQRIDTLSGRINTLLTLSFSLASGIAYASWDFIKSKLGI